MICFDFFLSRYNMEAKIARKLFNLDCLLVGLGCSLTLSMIAGGVTTTYFNKEKFIGTQSTGQLVYVTTITTVVEALSGVNGLMLIFSGALVATGWQHTKAMETNASKRTLVTLLMVAVIGDHTNSKGFLRVDGIRKKLCDEMFCFYLMHM